MLPEILERDSLNDITGEPSQQPSRVGRTSELRDTTQQRLTDMNMRESSLIHQRKSDLKQPTGPDFQQSEGID